MLKFVMMPPLDEMKRDWAARMKETLSQYRIVMAETDEDAKREIVDADAAFGWIPPDALEVARRLRWLQNPDAGPFIGYYYKEWDLVVNCFLVDLLAFLFLMYNNFRQCSES